MGSLYRDLIFPHLVKIENVSVQDLVLIDYKESENMSI